MTTEIPMKTFFHFRNESCQTRIIFLLLTWDRVECVEKVFLVFVVFDFFIFIFTIKTTSLLKYVKHYDICSATNTFLTFQLLMI